MLRVTLLILPFIELDLPGPLMLLNPSRLFEARSDGRRRLDLEADAPEKRRLFDMYCVNDSRLRKRCRGYRKRAGTKPRRAVSWTKRMERHEGKKGGMASARRLHSHLPGTVVKAKWGCRDDHYCSPHVQQTPSRSIKFVQPCSLPPRLCESLTYVRAQEMSSSLLRVKQSSFMNSDLRTAAQDPRTYISVVLLIACCLYLSWLILDLSSVSCGLLYTSRREKEHLKRSGVEITA